MHVKKKQDVYGWCHVQCAQTSAKLYLYGFDSTETDTMFFKTYEGKNNFINLISVKQISEDSISRIYLSPEYCYELYIPAAGKNYKIRGITINNDSMHYQGHRCTSTICFSRPYGGYINDTPAHYIVNQYETTYDIKK